MVVYRGKVLRVVPVYGESGNPIESWVVFEINKQKIEIFHSGIPIVPEINRVYSVDINLLVHTMFLVNIKEKYIKQISTSSWKYDEYQGRDVPPTPLYILEGELKSYGEKNKPDIIDVGALEIELIIMSKYQARNNFKSGDWVFVCGKMVGEIIKT